MGSSGGNSSHQQPALSAPHKKAAPQRSHAKSFIAQV
jgi:hypothetical protein